MRIMYQVGSLLLLGLKLQVYFLLKTLMGGVVFGVFPAFFGVFRIITICIAERDIYHVYLGKELKKFDKKEFIKTNCLGYIFAFCMYLLLLNLWVVQNYLQVRIFHFFTLFLIALSVSVFLYVVALFTKYELPIRQYFFQGFLCSIIGILETIAIALGFSIAIGLAYVLPVVGFFLGIPFLMFPHAWFSRSAVARFERVFYKIKENGGLGE